MAMFHSHVKTPIHPWMSSLGPLGHWRPVPHFSFMRYGGVGSCLCAFCTFGNSVAYYITYNYIITYAINTVITITTMIHIFIYPITRYPYHVVGHFPIVSWLYSHLWLALHPMYSSWLISPEHTLLHTHSYWLNTAKPCKTPCSVA